jgi:hypothetical protein
MQAIIDKARTLLQEGIVSCIIGYSANSDSNRLHPFIAKNLEDAQKLTFNHYALNNLSPFLPLILESFPGRVGILAKGCDVAQIYSTIKENNLNREDVLIIGIECHGVVDDYLKNWCIENVAPKCSGCLLQTPILVDEIVTLSHVDLHKKDKLVA